MKICAVVVTYNRLDLLKLTIEKLLNQTVNLDSIIIINNASNDGTEEYLKKLSKLIICVNLKENIGGAGGFNKGLRYAYDNRYDYIWIMDDDTIATENALEMMLKGLKLLKNENIGFVCSNVLYKDNNPCLMNIPKADYIWNKFSEFSLVKVRNASFVSLLINRQVIEKVGLPITEFFIWGDDLEYTSRINEQFNGYMIGNSIVHHYMKENLGVSIVETENRIDRYFYEFRNKLYIAKNSGFGGIINYIFYVVKILIKIFIKSNNFKWRKIRIVIKGVFSGLFFNPKVEYIKK
ncbi:glycosyltransferase family 2 protein [Candidatus Clostridium helianthi]|uniref:Glycosyltransferase family 2 protein n=1 Tax=Candidatus Clostridium helianthi TaxID=3381660 RepID=A0ABW8RY60_9CLOT